MNQIKIQKLHPEARIPTRGSEHAAGYDLYALTDINIYGKSGGAVRTGIAMQIKPGYYGKIESRSGLSFRRGIGTLAGVIDADYTGEIQVILMNNMGLDFAICQGDRIAQIIFHKHESPELIAVESLQPTDRGDNGFGSTGK